MKPVRALALTAATVGLIYAIGCQPQNTTGANPAASAAPSTAPTDNGITKVPASHKYYAQSDTTCVVCHTNVDPTTGNAVRFQPFPDSHKDRAGTTCLTCHQKAADTAPPVVDMTVARVSTGPVIDGVGDDAAWASATEASIPLKGGVNKSETTIKVKAVHDGTTVYFRAIVPDPTQSLERQPWVKTGETTWEKSKAWPDKYEDKLSMVWNNPAKPIAGFDQSGCAVTCHSVTPSWAGRPLMYTKNTGEMGDMWHAKTARHAAVPGIEQVDDQKILHPSDVEAASASTSTVKDGGRGGDAGGSDYTSNDKDTSGFPKWMPDGGDTKIKAGVGGNPFWMTATASFDNSKFAVGDKVAGHLVKKLAGSRGDIPGFAKWSNGNWVFEWKRAMTPTNTDNDDVVFEAGKTYSMGAAYFDNNQIGHSQQFGVTRVKFAD